MNASLRTDAYHILALMVSTQPKIFQGKNAAAKAHEEDLKNIYSAIDAPYMLFAYNKTSLTQPQQEQAPQLLQQQAEKIYKPINEEQSKQIQMKQTLNPQ